MAGMISQEWSFTEEERRALDYLINSPTGKVLMTGLRRNAFRVRGSDSDALTLAYSEGMRMTVAIIETMAVDAKDEFSEA